VAHEGDAQISQEENLRRCAKSATRIAIETTTTVRVVLVPDPFGAAGRAEAEVAADDRDDEAEDRRLRQAGEEVDQVTLSSELGGRSGARCPY
jgi:hypothetical protein